MNHVFFYIVCVCVCVIYLEPVIYYGKKTSQQRQSGALGNVLLGAIQADVTLTHTIHLNIAAD